MAFGCIVSTAPGINVRVLHHTYMPFGRNGEKGVPAGMVTSLSGLGAVPHVQLFPFVQSVLIVPVHILSVVALTSTVTLLHPDDQQLHSGL